MFVLVNRNESRVWKYVFSSCARIGTQIQLLEKQPTSRKRLAAPLQVRGKFLASRSPGTPPVKGERWKEKGVSKRIQAEPVVIKAERQAGNDTSRAQRQAKTQPFMRDDVPHTEATDRFNRPKEPIVRHKKREETPIRGRRVVVPDTNPKDRRAPWSREKPPQAEFVTEQSSQAKPKVFNPLTDDFDRSVSSEPANNLPSEFTSPPLMPGLLDSVVDVLGPHAIPTPIQALAIKHLLYPWKTKEDAQQMKWREFLLASETGSGKSIAYLLPLLQDLKSSELASEDVIAPQSQDNKFEFNPRALVLAPTHELSRQLSATAKSLSHHIKLRVVCASRANTPSTLTRNVTASKMSHMFDKSDANGSLSIHAKSARPLDVLVGTPSKLLEMVRGHGWNWDAAKSDSGDHPTGFGRNLHKFVVGKPTVGLHRVEWVIVDEADVLFGKLSAFVIVLPVFILSRRQRLCRVDENSSQ